MTLTEESCCAWGEQGLGRSRKSLLAAGHACFWPLLGKTGRLAASPKMCQRWGALEKLTHDAQSSLIILLQM